jgi:hypothetical protein
MTRIKRIQLDASKGKFVDENFDEKSNKDSKSSTPFEAFKNEQSDEKIKILKDDQIIDSIKKAVDENFYKRVAADHILRNQKK